MAEDANHVLCIGDAVEESLVVEMDLRKTGEAAEAGRKQHGLVSHAHDMQGQTLKGPQMPQWLCLVSAEVPLQDNILNVS